MSRHDTIDRMIEIEKMLMRLGNEAQGDADLWDAILAAQTTLHEAIYKKERAA
jgi:hypothetical protein